MKGRDSATEEFPVGFPEPGFPHQLGQTIRTRKFLHRLGKILVCPGVARHDPSDHGEDSAEIEEVEPPEDRIWRLGELQHDQSPVMGQNPMEFLKAPPEIREIPHPKGHHGALEKPVWEGEAKSVATNGNNW
jgi:hypothetical protein